MDIVKTFVSGVVVIGLVTAVGLHATGLAKVTQTSGTAASGLLHTSISG